MLSNINGKWLYDDNRSLPPKRKNKFDGRITEKSTSSSAHSRKDDPLCSDEEPITSIKKIIKCKKSITNKNEKRTKKSTKLITKNMPICG